MDAIGQRIYAMRIHRGLTQAELGEAIGESKQTIYKYERGIVTNIPLQKIEMIAKALRCDPTYLTGWEERYPDERQVQENRAEINEIFDQLPQELQSHALALLKGLVQQVQAPDDPEGSD